jgi:hypothetical protein
VSVEIRIRNWAKFQHFKDRRPPWVKLYRDLLDDLEWHKLDPAAAKTLVMIWLIASEYDGFLPDIETLAFRLRMPKDDLERIVSMLDPWLERVDTQEISERYHERYQPDNTCDITGDINPIPLARSRETETETETEKKKPSASRFDAQAHLVSLGAPAELAKEWLTVRKAKRLASTATAFDDAKAESDKAGISFADALRMCVVRGWGGFKASWLTEQHSHGRMNGHTPNAFE